jgi:hypothetical protein
MRASCVSGTLPVYDYTANSNMVIIVLHPELFGVPVFALVDLVIEVQRF